MIAYSHLPSYNKVGITNDRCSSSYEVRHRFHDIPGILPPRQSGQESKLQSHKCQATPNKNVCISCCFDIKLLSFFLQWLQLMLEIFQPLEDLSFLFKLLQEYHKVQHYWMPCNNLYGRCKNCPAKRFYWKALFLQVDLFQCVAFNPRF